jgi:hypothetical protein
MLCGQVVESDWRGRVSCGSFLLLTLHDNSLTKRTLF